jgi:hypothetical protein
MPDETVIHHPFQVTFDCADPRRQARFWALALGYVPQSPPPGFASWSDYAVSIGLPASGLDDVAAIVDPTGVAPRLLFPGRARAEVGEEPGAPRHQRPYPRRRITGAAAVDSCGRKATVADERRCHLRGGAVRRRQLVGDPPRPEGNEFCLQ